MNGFCVFISLHPSPPTPVNPSTILLSSNAARHPLVPSLCLVDRRCGGQREHCEPSTIFLAFTQIAHSQYQSAVEASSAISASATPTASMTEVATSATPTVVTATRLVKSLADVAPFFVTDTQIIVWTQTPEPVATSSV